MLTVAAVCYSLPETAVKISALQAYGIHAVAVPFHTASNVSYMMVAFGGIEILVPSLQYDEALQILAQTLIREETPMARAFARHPIRNGLAILIQWFLGVPLPTWARRMRVIES